MVVICGAGKWQGHILEYFIKLDKDLCLVAPENISGIVPKVFINEDLRNDVEIINNLEQYAGEIELVFSDQSDIGIRLVSLINERFNFNGLHHEQAKWFYDKLNFNSLMKLELPQFNKRVYSIKSVSDLERILLTEPQLVIKPTDAQSSKGVALLDGNSDLNSLFHEALKYSINSQLIAESFLRGNEYTVEAMVQNGVVEILAISKKEHLRFGIADVLYYSQEYINQFPELELILSKICQTTRVENSMLHGEFMFDGNNLAMIELACRGGGTNISGIILQSLLGYSPVYKVIGSLMGETVKQDVVNVWNNVGLFFITFKRSNTNSTVLKHLLTIEQSDHVLELGVEIDIDKELPLVLDDRSRHGYIIIGGNDKSEILNIIKSINRIAEYEIVKETFG